MRYFLQSLLIGLMCIAQAAWANPDVSCSFELTIMVVDARKRSPVEGADVKVVYQDGSTQELETDLLGACTARLKCDIPCQFLISHKRYYETDTILQLKASVNERQKLTIHLKPEEIICPLPESIYFSDHSDSLWMESKVWLDALVNALEDNPHLGVKLTGRFSLEEADENLAYRRAWAAKKYLMDEGIEAFKILPFSGLFKPNLELDDVASLAEEEKERAVAQSNRRVDYELMKLEKSIFKATVIDARTKKPLENATVFVVGTDGSSNEATTDEEGKVTMKLNYGHSFVITASHTVYLSKTGKMTWVGKPNEPINQTFELEDYHCHRQVPYIYFKRGSAELSEEAKVSLNGLVTTLGENPTIVINVEGSVDAEVAKRQNQLGMKRAKAIVKYLVDNGIDKERLVPIDHGYKPKTAEYWDEIEYGTLLSEEFIKTLSPELQDRAHNKNRAVGFSVQRKDFAPKPK